MEAEAILLVAEHVFVDRVNTSDRIQQVFNDQSYIRTADIQRLVGQRQLRVYRNTQPCRKLSKSLQKLARKNSRQTPQTAINSRLIKKEANEY